MSPGDEKILKTLELLVMLSRSRQQFSHGLTGEEKATLTVTRQLIIDAGLTIPEFTNSVHEIAQKGYIWHLVIFDDVLRSQIGEFLNGAQYETTLEKLKELNTKEISNKLKAFTTEQLDKILPRSVELDQEKIDKDHINFSDAFDGGIQVLKKMRADEIAVIILMPFRDIKKLFSKLNAGQRLNEVQDDGYWFNIENFRFHIDGKIIPTQYNNKPNKEHYVLEQLFKHPSHKKIYYDNLTAFDVSVEEKKELVSFRDACNRFIDKHPSLKRLFTAHIDHLEFHPERY